LLPFSALTPIVKPLGLISVIAPIGMLDLSSTLALTPSVKVGLSSKRWGMSEKIQGEGKRNEMALEWGVNDRRLKR
jgi:hypothetical protein